MNKRISFPIIILNSNKKEIIDLTIQQELIGSGDDFNYWLLLTDQQKQLFWSDQIYLEIMFAEQTQELCLCFQLYYKTVKFDEITHQQIVSDLTDLVKQRQKKIENELFFVDDDEFTIKLT